MTCGKIREHFITRIYNIQLTNSHQTPRLTGMGGSPSDVSEEPVMWEKRKKGWRMSCDIGEATEGLENEL